MHSQGREPPSEMARDLRLVKVLGYQAHNFNLQDNMPQTSQGALLRGGAQPQAGRKSPHHSGNCVRLLLSALGLQSSVYSLNFIYLL